MEATVITLLGKTLLTNALGELYGFLKDSHYSQELESVLSELDITAELAIVQAIINDVESEPETQSVKISTEQVKETVDQIRDELQNIHSELEYHKTRYFYTWRTPQYAKNLQRLKKYRSILRKRRELLIQVLSINNSQQRGIIYSPHTKHSNTGEDLDLERGIRHRRTTDTWLSS